LELGRLLLPTRPPRLLDTADGSSQPITGLPGAGDWTYGMHDLGGGRFVVTTRPYFSGQGTMPETSAYLVVAADASATPIAAGDDIALAADNASILVTRFSQTAGHTVRRHRLDGRPVGPAFRLPPGRGLIRGTVAGLLLGRDDGLREIWDPATGTVHHEFSQYGAVGPDLLSYNDHDAVVVVDLRTGGSKRVALPDGAGNVHESSLSRDGRYLAVAVTNLHFTAWTIVVYDRASNVLTVAPGGPFQAAHQAQSLVMSWNGDLLTLVNRGTAFLWQPGTPSLHEVPN
ncbi:MAG TPA: hypothetical protein VFX61_19140, partial [Micromonosporaceae bacterium]|nr:hypothetical protein [Micromonosporaceae bacterium]